MPCTSTVYLIFYALGFLIGTEYDRPGHTGYRGLVVYPKDDSALDLYFYSKISVLWGW